VKIRLGREHRVNVGDFEHIIVSGVIEFDEAELKDIKQDPMEYAQQQLDDLLSVDLTAAEAAVPEDRETHLNYWKGSTP
jgi:hypothetical protein